VTEIRPENIRNLKVLVDRQVLLAELPANGVVAELGVDQGELSQRILEIAKPRELHLIDPWGTERFGEAKFNSVTSMFAEEIRSGRITIHRGSSVDEIAKFPDGHFDWMYIDTTHAYEQTHRELRTCRRKVRPGGFIAGHDFTSGNVSKKLHYGVVQAVHEFCNSYGWEIVFLTHETDRYLSFALRAMSNEAPSIAAPNRAPEVRPATTPPRADVAPARQSLDELALKHNTDKSSRHHNYVKVYEKHFAPLRDRALQLLEIGIKEGASLRTWAEYFPNARVFGLDLHAECAAEATDRIDVFVGRQQDTEFLGRVCRGMDDRLDIVIDDGSHHNPFTLASFEFLFPRLAPGGIYVIEDLVCSYETSPRFENERSQMTDFFVELINAVDLNGRRDIFVPIKSSQDFAKIPDAAKTKLTPLERWVESVHFHQSICFIYKRES
jgi:predicted O-methyltransferase YrrM